MGFEYRIIAAFTKKQVVDIQGVLENNVGFDKKYEFDNKMFYDFRTIDNKGTMPNICVFLESDGIYICRYDTPNIWENLQELKEHLDNKGLGYSVLDY
ncbi:hypothetical protein ABW636_17575 [Aquimarina sp. 2201CG1-2-11]|uniref:hypothetical protein n=1 Tax=Aquimarina discodermiae TaxID=3231043 RepID=UPI003462E8CD